MTPHRARLPFRPPTIRLLLSGLWTTVFVLTVTVAPASAQYGGTPTLFVDPVQVEIDSTFDAVGFNCPGASEVTITIDGISGILGTTIAADDNSYAADGIDMPDGVVAGQEYDVRATCAGGSATFRITAVCNGGSLPVNGVCPDGRTVGGADPNPSTTTTTTTAPGGTTGGSGGTSGSDDTILAVTGASFVEQAVQIGATLVALGAILVLFTARRREPTEA
jgi:hypothetical protein